MNREATRQEMRAFVCGQCHVEYYFKGPEKRLTYPWAKGLKVDEILAYYDENRFTDWTHARPARRCSRRSIRSSRCGTRASTRAPASPAPTATCRTCASARSKISDHHVRSPLLNINRACQTCHKWPEDELRGARRDDPGPHFAMRNRAMDALVALIGDIEGGAGRGHDGRSSSRCRARLQRKAQFLLDFVEAENSMGFHAPQEALRDPGRVDRLLAAGTDGAARRAGSRGRRCRPNLR